MRTIKGEKGKVTDCEKKIITSVPNTSEWKSYSEEWQMCSSLMATLEQKKEVEEKWSKKTKFLFREKKVKLISY